MHLLFIYLRLYHQYNLYQLIRFYILNVITVDENIIGALKMQNNFWRSVNLFTFPMLRQQYWTFLFCSPFSYSSSNIAIPKVVALHLFSSFLLLVLQIVSFPYYFPYINFFAIAFKGENKLSQKLKLFKQVINLERATKKRKKELKKK